MKNAAVGLLCLLAVVFGAGGCVLMLLFVAGIYGLFLGLVIGVPLAVLLWVVGLF